MRKYFYVTALVMNLTVLTVHAENLHQAIYVGNFPADSKCPNKLNITASTYNNVIQNTWNFKITNSTNVNDNTILIINGVQFTMDYLSLYTTYDAGTDELPTTWLVIRATSVNGIADKKHIDISESTTSGGNDNIALMDAPTSMIGGTSNDCNYTPEKNGKIINHFSVSTSYKR